MGGRRRAVRRRRQVFGAATGGPRAGRRLDPVDHMDTFWFAGATFRPATVVVG